MVRNSSGSKTKGILLVPKESGRLFWRNNNGWVGTLCLLLSYRPTRVFL